jgi:solute carrier family 8 (sodium/calcium exchanger)
MKKCINGTHLKISQSCSNNACSYSYTWESQPFIKNIPLGNIMLSGAILFSGALPTVAIKIFENLRCCAVSRRTYFRHQALYLQPAVSSVWKNHQVKLMNQLKEENVPLIIGGDGRADSPGHCAKFGSYSFVDLVHNYILDVQLVQVSMIVVV